MSLTKAQQTLEKMLQMADEESVWDVLGTLSEDELYELAQLVCLYDEDREEA